MLVRNTRVRTTSFSEAPARCSARSMFLQSLHRLRVGIARADDFAVIIGCGCTRNVNVRPTRTARE